MTSRQHTVIALILVLTGIYLMHLSGIEIQPWDEGLYAVRAKSIVEFNSWWDQTEHAIGGLYSSTAPPFVPWLIAMSMSVIGPTAIAVRLPIVLCSAVALWMMYLIARRMVTHEHAVLAVCILAGTMHWAVFSRQAMTEVPLMMWCLIALWSAIVWHESGAGRRWSPAVFGIAFGMALMTKMLVSFVPLLFLVPLIITHRKSVGLMVWVALALGIAFAIAAPWYLMMASTHGSAFLAGLPFMHFVTAVEGNERALGPLFYVNQLVTGHAILVLALLFVTVAMIKREFLPSRTQYPVIAALTWFISGLLILSVAATKHIHYTVMIVPAATLVAVYAAERFLLLANRRFVVVSYGVVGALTIWSMLPVAHRQDFRTAPFDSHVLLEGMVIAIVVCVGLLVPRKRLQTLALQLFKPVLYGVAALFVVRTAAMTIGNTPSGVRGGRDVAIELLDTTTPSFTYLYHKRNDGDALNPQLAWYLDGWMNGWSRGRTYTPVSLPEDEVTDSAAVLGVQATSVFIVYHHAGQPHTERLNRQVHAVLMNSYESKEYENYTLFIRKRI